MPLALVPVGASRARFAGELRNPQTGNRGLLSIQCGDGYLQVNCLGECRQLE
jgi:hypothetical protein